MTILQIPIKAVAAQTLDITLNNQYVSIALQSRNGRMYASVSLDKTPIVLERVCLDGVPIVNEAYHGMVGDLYFVDTQGKSDPTWSEIGTRFILVYFLNDGL